MPNKTLSLKQPFGRTLGLSLIFLLMLIGLLEVSLHANPLQPYLDRSVPSLGSRHHQLESQLARLEKLVASEGSIDCIVMGSSLVWLGVKPSTFEESFRQETGQNIRCFNLGIETLPAGAAGPLAEFIVERYQPKLLIYGTSARDYGVDYEAEDTKVILDTPWLQYQLGQPSIQGWLFTHYFTLRYLPFLRSQVMLDTESLRETQSEIGDLSGFLAKYRPAQEVHVQAAAKDAAQWLKHYEVRQENLSGLEHILGQQRNGTQIVVVEMPVSSTYYDYFGKGKTDYDRFVNSVEPLVRSRNVPFLRAPDEQLIPEEGWWNRSHMNVVGAEIYSNWLGEQIGKAVIDGYVDYHSPIQ